MCNNYYMKINLIRYANSLDPAAPYLKDSEQFLEDINNELFEDDLELVEGIEDPIYSIIFIETGGSEQKFVLDVDKLKQPIILLSNCKNNSLPACFEIKTYLESKEKECVLLFGEEANIANSIKHISKIMQAKHNIEHATLGVIGKPSDWLIASTVNYEEAKKRYGVTLIDIESSELKEEINKGMLTSIPRLEELQNSGYDKDTLNGALLIYSGLKRIIEKYKLNGFTLRCFDLIEEYKNTACLAFAILNEEGYIATCEGDVPSMLSMLLIKEATNQPSFQANPSKIDIKESNILFAHCTIPFNMLQKYELMTHFESGLGIGVRGTLDKNHITIFKIAPNLKDALCVTGNIKENLTLPNYCRTQILVNLERDELFEFLKESFGNHVLIAYNDIAEDILTLFHFFADFEK